MWTYLPRYFAAPAPRYTSYPTAAEFGPAVGAADQAAALAGVAPDAKLSLYLHIPYCDRICWYCGCNTGAANRPERLTAYVEALKTEIATVARCLGGRGKVASVHFGGGSPNVLSAAAFGGIVTALRRDFALSGDVELAVELDPRSLPDSFVDELGRSGVTRVSLGVQTFAAHIQQKINRMQPFEMVEGAVKRLRAAGVAGINFDLMYGLPGQMAQDVVETARQVIALAPDRVAVFGYAHLPRMLPRQRMILDADLPGTAARFAQARVANQTLRAAGYRAIGFDHFACPGDSLAVAADEGRLRRNFQGYTDDPADVLIGLGASAISDFPGLLVQNEKDAGAYRARALAGELAGIRGVPRTAEDRLRGRVIERLLCDAVVDIGAECRTQQSADDALDDGLDALAPFIADGLVSCAGRTVMVAPEALPYLRVIARSFDAYRTTPTARFSRAI
jgi:oxygen-independent coproporphyrinogen-3 oxidase